ncbi:MAG: gluconolactonase [Salinisphaeraceae bacterium]|nr:gluconolactonase [Salinisphaeraceae bacterium]
MKRFFKRLALLLVMAVGAVAAYLLLWPVPIQPVAWQAPASPGLKGPYARNNALAQAQRLPTRAPGPEDVAVDAQGRVYGGFADGSIRRLEADGSQEALIATTGGRPLGLAWGPDGSLIVADAVKGVLAIRPNGGRRLLTDSYRAREYGFVDDVDVAADGTVYFSDASKKFRHPNYMADILEHGGHGRLYRYEPLADEVTLLLDGLQFANGVAVGPDERYIMVVETGAYRVTRYWLTGERAGEHEVVIDNLPGLPDGISHAGEGRFWIALFAPRDTALDYMADKPWLRKLAYRLPAAARPAPEHYAMVLGIDAEGQLLHNLQHGGAGAYAPITSVEQVGDRLYLGSLERSAIAVLPAP